jgi:hypothetical protein
MRPTKVSADRPSIRDELVLCLLTREDNCRSSWRDLTQCQISLPQHLDLTIRVYGGSGTAQVLFQSIVDRPTNIVGQIGQILLNPRTQLLTMVSIAIVVGQTECILGEILVHPNFHLAWYAFRRPTRSHDSLPRNRVQISGVSRISGTTFATEAEIRGLGNLFVLTTKRLIRTFASSGLGMARLLPSIYRRLAIVLLVTLSGRCFGRTRNY